MNIQHLANDIENKYILVFTSNSLEKDAINQQIQNKIRLDTGIDTSGCYIGTIPGDIIVIHMSGESGASKEKSIHIIAQKFLHNPQLPKPAFIVLTGFCWGNKNKVELLNTIISTEITSINSSIITGAGITYKEHTYKSRIHNDVCSHFESLTIKNHPIHHGALLSTETLFSSDDHRDNTIRKFPDYFGGEMEAFALIPAISDLKWCIIKSVSDYGDSNFDRSKQIIAAKTAASVFVSLAATLININPTPELGNNSDYKRALDIIKKSTFIVNKQATTMKDLNDFLEKMAPEIEQALIRKSINTKFGQEFTRNLAVFLVEVAQNSIKHGNATTVEIFIHYKKVVISDDGKEFNFSDLKGNKGGAIAWQRIVCKKAPETISRATGNSYTWDFESLDRELQMAKEKCAISINEGSIGDNHFDGGCVLAFNKDCEKYYFDTSYTYMISRKINIIDNIIDLIKSENKHVFIEFNAQDENEITERLKNAGVLDKVSLLKCSPDFN